MSIASDNLVKKYSAEIKQYAHRAVELKALIISAKTSTKRGVYQRKLKKNNQKSSHVIMKLGKLLDIKNGDEK